MQKKEWATRTKHDRADSTTRAVLLTAARRVFEHSGYARTTVARITEEAGVGRATFYVYFSSKEEVRSEEHTSELQSRFDLVCRLLLEKKKKKQRTHTQPIH